MEEPIVDNKTYYLIEVKEKKVWICVYGSLGGDIRDCLEFNPADGDQIIPRALPAAMLVNEVPASQVPIILRQAVLDRQRIAHI